MLMVQLFPRALLLPVLTAKRPEVFWLVIHVRLVLVPQLQPSQASTAQHMIYHILYSLLVLLCASPSLCVAPLQLSALLKKVAAPMPLVLWMLSQPPPLLLLLMIVMNMSL